MSETIIIIVISILSTFGLLSILQQLMRAFVFGRDTAATVKIIRVKSPQDDAEFVIRAAENHLEHVWGENNAVILLVYGDEDDTAKEICMRFGEEYGNIRPCSEQMLPQEIVRITGLQTDG